MTLRKVAIILRYLRVLPPETRLDEEFGVHSDFWEKVAGACRRSPVVHDNCLGAHFLEISEGYYNFVKSSTKFTLHIHA